MNTVAPLLARAARRALAATRRRAASASVAASLLLVAGVTGALAWNTQTMIGLMEIEWQAAYIGNPQATSLPTSGWTANEHAELTHVILQQLGAAAVFGMQPAATGSTIVVDLNAALYQPQVMAEEDYADNPMTLLEERLVPPPAHFAGLPDFSWALHDWINKNTLCPLDNGSVSFDACHSFDGWMGALNANHFGTQARFMYLRYHQIALALAGRAQAMRTMLASNPAAAAAYVDFVKEAEIEALTYEAIGQHFLQDRWSTGHMWERWNGADQTTAAIYEQSFVIGLASGLLHGSEGVTKLPDPMNSPQVDSGMAFPSRWRIRDEIIRDGVGDYRLEDMHDNAFGFEYGLGDLAIGVPEQKERLFSCGKAGFHAVISAFGQVEPGHYGAHDVVLTGGPFPNVLSDHRCWEGWATNDAIAAGWFEHPALSEIEQESRTVGQILTTSVVGELRERLTPAIETTWHIATQLHVEGPDATNLARGDIGPFSGIAVGTSFRVPDYTEPQNLDDLPVSDPRSKGRDKHTLYGFFNRSHADFWCGTVDGDLATFRGSNLPIEREVCSHLGDRVYKGTDPAYQGVRSEKRKHMTTEIDPICKYYGVETVGVNEDLPFYLHPGYVATPESKNTLAYDSITNWCNEVPVIDRMMCPGPQPPAGDAKWDVVGRTFEQGGLVTLTGHNFGDAPGAVTAGPVEGMFPVALPTGGWSDTQITLNLPPDHLTAGDWFLKVCPAGMPAPPCSVGRFILRVGDGGGATIHSGFAGSVEGWTHEGASTFTGQVGGGNPGGYLYIDNSEGPITYIFASAAYEGDLSGYLGGTIAFDGNMLDIGGSDWNGDDYGNIRITGTAGTATADLVPDVHTGTGVGNPPRNRWTTFARPLSEGSWNVFGASLAQILADVTEIRLSVEALFGPEVQGIDNFRVSGPTGDVCTLVP